MLQAHYLGQPNNHSVVSASVIKVIDIIEHPFWLQFSIDCSLPKGKILFCTVNSPGQTSVID